jgi:hypothetical protein
MGGKHRQPPRQPRLANVGATAGWTYVSRALGENWVVLENLPRARRLRRWHLNPNAPKRVTHQPIYRRLIDRVHKHGNALTFQPHARKLRLHGEQENCDRDRFIDVAQVTPNSQRELPTAWGPSNRTACYAACSRRTSQPGNTSTASWQLNACANAFAFPSQMQSAALQCRDARLRNTG